MMITVQNPLRGGKPREGPMKEFLDEILQRSSNSRGPGTESKPPNIMAALNYRLQRHPHDTDRTNPQNPRRSLHGWCAPTGRFCPTRLLFFDPFCEEKKEGGSTYIKYGSGASVYFKFLKLLTWVFALCTICSVPLLLVNVNGKARLSSLSAITLSSTTIANSGFVGGVAGNSTTGVGITTGTSEAALLFQDVPGWKMVAPGSGLTPTKVGLIYSGCDLVMCCVLFAGWLWLRWGEKYEEELVDQTTTTAEDYTIYLPEVPSWAREESLKQHFERLLKDLSCGPKNHPRDFYVVEDVHCVDADAQVMKLMLQAGKLTRKNARLEQAVLTLEEERKNEAWDWPCCSREAKLFGVGGLLLQIKQNKEAIDALVAQAQEHKRGTYREVVAAFVTFRHQEAKQWVVLAYGTEHSCLAFYCQPRRYRLQFTPSEDALPPNGCCCTGHLTVHSAPAPSNIIWQNLGVTAREHAARVCATGSLAFIFLLATFGALWFASAYTAALQQMSSQAQCEGALADSVPAPVPFSPAIATLHACGSTCNATSAAVKFCTCATLPWSSLSYQRLQMKYGVTGMLDAADCPFQSCPQWLSLDPEGVWKQSFCVDWLGKRAQSAALVIFAAVFVLCINSVLGYIMRLLTSVEGHHSWEDLNASLALRLFLASFINTAVLVVLINVAWPFTLPTEQLKTGKYPDFVAGWYDNVGSSLLTTMLINVFSPHLYPVICWAWHYCFLPKVPTPSDQPTPLDQPTPHDQPTQRGACYFLRSTKAPTLHDQGRKLLGPYREPALRYAQLFNTLFVCFVFSTGLPLMIPIAATSFLVFYWVDKALFQYYYRKPHALGVHLQQYLSGLIPYAIILHLAVGTWMVSGTIYAQTNLGLSRLTDPVAATLASLQGGGSTLKMGSERVLQQGVLPLFVLFLLTSIFFVLRFVWLFLQATCVGFVNIITCGQILREGTARRKDWELKTPAYRESMSPHPGHPGGAGASSSTRSLKMQGIPSYNMLLNPEIMHSLGVDEQWALSHTYRDLPENFTFPMPSYTERYAPNPHPRPTRAQFGLYIPSDVAPIPAPHALDNPFYQGESSAYEEDYHSDMSCDGETAGVPPSLASSRQMLTRMHAGPGTGV